jgi:quercetin dioxygenase-like cupin family protein
MTTLAQLIPKGLIDSSPAVALLLRLGDHYAARALPATGIDSHLLYECPRSQVMVRTAVKGSAIGAHFHAVSDEIVVVTGGAGELLVNGEWRPVKAGDVHVNPRGIVHDTRALGEHLHYLSIFTPRMPPGNDINFVP